MKKMLFSILLLGFALPSSASSASFIETKDFRSSGDYLYKIVGKKGNDECHVCTGIVEISALDKSGKVVAKGSTEIGAWGMPQDGWKFKKSKGKVVAYVEDCFTAQGQTECSTVSARVSGKKVVFKTSH